MGKWDAVREAVRGSCNVYAAQYVWGGPVAGCIVAGGMSIHSQFMTLTQGSAWRVTGPYPHVDFVWRRTADTYNRHRSIGTVGSSKCTVGQGASTNMPIASPA